MSHQVDITQYLAAEAVARRETKRAQNEHHSAMHALNVERAMLNDPNIRGDKKSAEETGFELVPRPLSNERPSPSLRNLVVGVLGALKGMF